MREPQQPNKPEGKHSEVVTMVQWLQCCSGYYGEVVTMVHWLQCCSGNHGEVVTMVHWLLW